MTQDILMNDTLLVNWTNRIVSSIDGVVAILLKGSYARGDAGFWSDVDFDVLVETSEIEAPYLTWLDTVEDHTWHVSIAVDPLESWLAEEHEPVEWAFGFPARPAMRLLWTARPALNADLDRPYRTHPAAEPELEDAFESLGKARNALRRHDELTARLALRDLGLLVPTLLVPVNPPLYPATKPEALRMALAQPIAPAGYRDDLLALLGLDGLPHTAADLLTLAERLMLGVLDLLEQHVDTVAPLLAPNLGDHLRDGTFRRYLHQRDDLDSITARQDNARSN